MLLSKTHLGLILLLSGAAQQNTPGANAVVVCAAQQVTAVADAIVVCAAQQVTAVAVAGGQLSLPPCEHTDRWVSMSSVERSFYDRLHKQVVSTQAQHQASQKKRRPAGSSRNPTRSVCPCPV